jgi:hypothetical protein
VNCGSIFIEVKEAIQMIGSSAVGTFDSFQYDQKSWKGSGWNLDWAFMLPGSLFSEKIINDHAGLYNELAPSGESGLPSQASFEESAPREPGAPVPEPAAMLLLGGGLIGVAAAPDRGMDNWNALLESADRSLYRTKREGRNTVVAINSRKRPSITKGRQCRRHQVLLVH